MKIKKIYFYIYIVRLIYNTRTKAKEAQLYKNQKIEDLIFSFF